MGNLHLNLTADEDMRRDILDLLRGQIRVVVSEERDRLLKEQLPGAIARAITVDALIDRVFPKPWNGTSPEREELRGMVDKAVRDASAEVKAHSKELIDTYASVDITRMIDKRISDLLGNSETLDRIVTAALRKALSKMTG